MRPRLPAVALALMLGATLPAVQGLAQTAPPQPEPAPATTPAPLPQDDGGRVSAPATPTPTPATPTPAAPASQPAAPQPEPAQEPATAAPATNAAPESPASTGPASATGEPTEHEKAGRCVEGSEQACLALTRQGKDGKERRILVVRTGTSDDTGIYTVCGPRDNDPEDTPNIGVFSETGPGGIRVTIDKNVIRVPLAIVTQRPAKEGEDGSDGRVEASAGTAKFLDNAPEGATDRLLLCGVEARSLPIPDTVLVTQGKTQLKGQKVVYDETDGIARIDGPITFNRDNEKDPLAGSSDNIEVNVDDESTLLVGNVVLRSAGGRVSKAARVEYDDTNNVAYLYATAGQPAESVKGTDRISINSGYIYYNLDKNEVHVEADKTNDGNITGEFQDGGDSSEQTK